MRLPELKWRPQVDPGYGVVLLLCALALWPFLSRASLPHQTDAELHIFRLAELSRLVRAGVLYPRWAPNFYYGYGYPIFNYYAPLTYYLGLLWDLLPGLGPVAAVKLMFCLGLVGAGLGMYGFVREGWGRPAGWVAAGLYVYAPYVQFIEPHARGVLPESFSLAVFPLALWAHVRLQRRLTPRRWLAAIVLTAAVILTHNLMAMVFGALLAAWWLWQRVVMRPTPTEPKMTAGWVGAATFALGVGIAAFFWLPLGLEREAVTLSNLVGGGHYDFRAHFLAWSELLSPSLRLDWGATEPAYRFNLGLAQWVAGGLGLVLWLGGRAGERRRLAFWAATLIGLLFLMLPVSEPVWRAIPALPYLQFPWRLLGPAAAALAILGGVGVATLAENLGGPVGRWLTPTMVATILGLALPLSQPPPWGEFGDTSALAVMQIELEGRWLGTTSTADFVPATVTTIPRVADAVLADYAAGRLPERLNRATLPTGAQVTATAITPLHTQYQVDTPTDFLLRLYLFDFPGWVARVDGEVTPIQVAEPEGFITVWTPAGRHTLDVAFESTPARRWGWGVSGLALAASLSGAWVWRRVTPVGETGPTAAREKDAFPQARALSVGALGLLAVLALLLEPAGWLHWDSAEFHPQPAQVSTFLDYGHEIALTGYTPPPSVARPGDTLDIILYWQAQRSLTENYQAFVHILRPDGAILTQADKLNPGDFPTERWPLDKYVRDAYRLTLPPDTPAGVYRLTAGLWQMQTGRRLDVFDAAGRRLGDFIVIQMLQVGAP